MFAILYIEDEPSHRALVSRLLAKQPNIQLLLAETGEQGLVLARMANPDLILLDMRLPDISGLSVLHRLKSDGYTRDIPVLALTTAITEWDIQRTLAAGVCAILSKPLNLTQLLDMIRGISQGAVECPGLLQACW